MNFFSAGSAVPAVMLVFTNLVYAALEVPEQGAELGPLISGTSSYVDGTYVWTDYAYDDRGPNADMTDGGDAEYPNGLENSADIIQVQVGRSADHISLLALLETLTDPAIPEIGFALDVDNDPATGAISIPGGSWSTSTPLGIELLIVVNNDATTIREWNGESWQVIGEIPSRFDAQANTVAAELPLSSVDPGSGTWRVFALAGLASDSFTSGGTIYDLAFVKGELITDRNTMIADSVQGAFVTGGTTMWQDHRQASILAGELDTSHAAASIDFGKVRTGITELANADEPGWYTFLHRSQLTLAEGVIEGEGALGAGPAFTTRVYLGPYQPYLVLHRGDPQVADNPLVVFLHGASQTHTQNTYFFDPPEAGNTFNYPAVTVFPLARGETLSYEGVAEFDVLEVMADALKRLPVDQERVVLAGFSMGGEAAYKLASLYPDRFSTAIAHFGTGEATHGIMENLVNLPFRADNGMIDYLVSAPLFLPDRDRGLELGYDFRFFDVTNAHHALQPHLANCLYLNALTRTRVLNPPRVRYVVEPERVISDPETGLTLSYDSAYWVSGIELREGATRGVVDALTLGKAHRASTSEVIDQRQSALGRDYCGENAAVQPNPGAGSEWRERSVVHTPAPPDDTANAVEMELSSVGSLSLDLARMSLTTQRPLQLDISGDGQTTLTLLGDWTGLVDLTKDGVDQPGYNSNADGSLTLVEDFSGSHTYVLSARSATQPATWSRSSGGGAISPVYLVLLALLLLVSRWRVAAAKTAE